MAHQSRHIDTKTERRIPHHAPPVRRRSRRFLVAATPLLAFLDVRDGVATKGAAPATYPP
jgi:hypothetical protein